MRKLFNLTTLLNIVYIVLIIVSFLLVPYHNIRTGFTNWAFTNVSGVRGPVNTAALAVQRALTLALVIFYIYNVRLRRKIRYENLEVDMAIRESEERRHQVEREYFRLRRQMQNIFDTMEDCVLICGTDYKVEYMNQSSKVMFGEGKGKKCHEVIYKTKEPCPWCFVDRILNGETITWEHEHEINKRLYRIHSSPFVNPDASTSMIFVYHDITKEKAVGGTTIESAEDYFRNIFENLPVACFGYDREARIVAWNRAASKLYGFRKEEVMGRSMFETISDEKDRQTTFSCIQKVFEGESFDALEWEDKNKEGAALYVYTNTYPLYNHEGKIIMGVSANIDITARKKMENDLKDSKIHLEKIMETPNSLIVELDHGLNIIRFNKGCEEVTGYARAEVIGKNWLELFVPERLKEAVKFVFSEVKKDSTVLPRHFENPIITKEGEERIILWSNANLKNEQGNVTSIIAMGDDVTERKKTHQKIIEAQTKYKMFLETVPIHIAMIDASGKFVIWNKYSETMLGYTSDEVIGKLTPRAIHETAEEATEVLETASRDGRFDREIMLVHKNGEKVPARLVVVPFKVENKIAGFYGFAEDLSQRKKTEKALLSVKEKMETMALKDPLTELYNNHYVVERVNDEFERAKRSFAPLSVLLIDVDYFKAVNDKYGHDFGDKVLLQTATLLKSELRTNDVLARWAGEEFMIALPEIGRENAVIVARKIHHAFKNKGFGDENNTIHLTCSIGMVSYPEDPIFTAKEFLEAVENSVFKVKGFGGNGIGSLFYGLIKDDEKLFRTEKDRLLASLKEKLQFFAVKGEDSMLEAIHSLSKTLELKDHTTRIHADNTIRYAIKLARKLEMSEREIENVRRAAILHDIGKLGIPDNILLKKGPLTEAEYEIVRQHPKFAAEIMSVADFLKESVPYVIHHHERYDGNGYPNGLKAGEIPLGARIIAVVDVYEALTSDRPYHKAMLKKEALQEIKRNAGTQFDPRVVTAFLEIVKA